MCLWVSLPQDFITSRANTSAPVFIPGYDVERSDHSSDFRHEELLRSALGKFTML